MSVPLRKPLTSSEFLAWEERHELRHECDGAQPIAMAGGTYEHDAIQVNLITALNNRLRGTRCRVHGNSLKIRVLDSIRYPDAFVSSAPIQRYVIVEQDSIAATVFTREGPIWAARVLTEGDVLAMPEIGVELALADIYEGVALPPADNSADVIEADGKSAD